jgi:nitrate/nitrite transporter NarK
MQAPTHAISTHRVRLPGCCVDSAGRGGAGHPVLGSEKAVRRPDVDRQEDMMHTRQASPTVLLILLCVAAVPTALSLLMMAPLLVDLAQAFQTSVGVVGQLAAATALTWGLIAPLAGPVADAYGRRRLLLTGLLLMALGILGSVMA